VCVYVCGLCLVSCAISIGLVPTLQDGTMWPDVSCQQSSGHLTVPSSRGRSERQANHGATEAHDRTPNPPWHLSGHCDVARLQRDCSRRLIGKDSKHSTELA